MKILFQICLAMLVTGCASSFRPVYTSADGDYYLEESSTASSYYETGSVLSADVGFHPWWVDPYNPLQYVYYSPNFYPHYFSIWYPPVYSPYYRYYSFYPGYYPDWCPPYRAHRAFQSNPAQPGVPGVVDGMVNGHSPFSRADIWRSQDSQTMNRLIKSGKGTNYKAYESPRPITDGRSAPFKPVTSNSAMGFSRPAGFSSPAPRANSSKRSYSGSGVSPRRSKQ